ncbi:MAG: AAA domain-containing protein [Maioricimonas sp. JB049]
MLPGTSLFDQADVRFQRRITLREHFRCMPEIIRFSNDLCYRATPLVPLRQYPPDRLTPLIDRFVVDGYREGSSQRVINRPEAAAVVKAVAKCLDDPRYEGRSFGVICLQGAAQAQLIEQMLLERIGPEPFKDTTTRLLCGDPYSFQGDERDVIFLTMVAAANGETRNAALTQKRYTQRFNVAASRARDQMWLFRSLREVDLHPQCMRRRMIQFMSSDPELLSPDIDVQRLREAGRAADRSVERPSPPFDSWFEVDVYLALVGSGYRVVPQFPAAGKRIDLVVEGPRGRIAVECDGDEWHGPEQYESDCNRQRILERAGWRFIRLRASSFYANRQRAIDSLEEQLTAAGIAPWPVTDGSATFHAADVGEIRGADCLDWVGKRTSETAESELADTAVDDDLVDDPDATDAPDSVTAAPVSIESVALNSASPAGLGQNRREQVPLRQVAVLAESQSDDDLPAERGTPDHPRTESSEPLQERSEECDPVEVPTVVECLKQAAKPLTAGQIRFRTGISEEEWPDVEQLLLKQPEVHMKGNGRRAKFALVAEADTDVGEAPTSDQANSESDFASIDGETWFRIAHWAKLNDHLQPWQRSLAYSLGKRRTDGIEPTEKQMIQGQRILRTCHELGFFGETGDSSSGNE